MNNQKEVLFSVPGKMVNLKEFLIASFKNGKPEDVGTEIQCGCKLTIPDKFLGDPTFCIISHGSGGIGSDTQLFVESLGYKGIATLVVDSFTSRNISTLDWSDATQSYMAPKDRALETFNAYQFLKDNEYLTQNLNLDKLACVGFSWGADTMANLMAWWGEQLPADTFYSLVYGNLWPFERRFFKGREHDITVYHGSDDNWTSAEKGKIFAEKTNSEFVEFFGCTHGFCKPGKDGEIVPKQTINYHVDYPIPTELKAVWGTVATTGKLWHDAEFEYVDAKMDYDHMATERVIADIVHKLKD